MMVRIQGLFIMLLMMHCRDAGKAAGSASPLKIGAIPLPAGYTRLPQSDTSFGAWLRNLSLKRDRTVYLYNGVPKRNQTAQYAVIDLSVGDKDLQQCADAVMRLKAEYLYNQKAYNKIHFHATDGTLLEFESWQKGYRYQLKNGRLYKALVAAPSADRASFNRYLEMVFSFAGTLSLQKELLSIKNHQDMQPGDVFIQGGSPGHAVIIVDVAINNKGDKIFLLAQSYMPAQDIHVLKNLSVQSDAPWYNAAGSSDLVTPEWHFATAHLARFP